jgi:hypothetical protein
MSTPFYFDVLMNDIRIYRNQRIGTISYGLDLEDKNTWIQYFKNVFLSYEGETFKRFEWFPNFASIVIHREGNPAYGILKKDIYISHEDIFGKDFDEEEYRIKKINCSAWDEMQKYLKIEFKEKNV